MTRRPHVMVVDIEDEYRGWMGAGKVDIEDKILMTRYEYYL